MSNTLQTKLDTIKNEKDTKLLASNLRAGITALGITGTAAGLDPEIELTADLILGEKNVKLAPTFIRGGSKGAAQTGKYYKRLDLNGKTVTREGTEYKFDELIKEYPYVIFYEASSFEGVKYVNNGAYFFKKQPLGFYGSDGTISCGMAEDIDWCSFEVGISTGLEDEAAFYEMYKSMVDTFGESGYVNRNSGTNTQYVFSNMEYEGNTTYGLIYANFPLS